MCVREEGEDRFTATAIVAAGHTNLTQILPVLQSLDSSFINGVTTQLAESGLRVSCKAGCGACCRQMVPLTIFEAEALSDWSCATPTRRPRFSFTSTGAARTVRTLKGTCWRRFSRRLQSRLRMWCSSNHGWITGEHFSGASQPNR